MSDKDALMEMESQNLEVEKIRMYVIWYEYAQYLNDRKKLDKRIYKDWNLISGQKFDSWWKENWRLFAEPKKGLVKKVSSIPKSADSKKIYLEIPLDTNADTLIKNCKSIIDSELNLCTFSSKLISEFLLIFCITFCISFLAIIF